MEKVVETGSGIFIAILISIVRGTWLTSSSLEQWEDMWKMKSLFSEIAAVVKVGKVTGSSLKHCTEA